jgi:cyclopropane fatty-acyl-phospholipid synthase-like methyltransferase
MFKKYQDSRRKNGGSQSERSFLKVSGNVFEMYGYHNYKYNKGIKNPIILQGGKPAKQLEYLKKVNFNEDSTLLDIGCANGVIGLSLLFSKNFKNITLVDHDKEYITNINTLINWDNSRLKDKVNTVNTEFGKYNEPHDYVLVLSLIHWLYSATADYGCLFKVVEEIKKNVKVALFIEWIDNADPVFKVLHHIDFNPQIHKTPYNKENFLKALQDNFSSIQLLGKTTGTRELYMCSI